MSRLTGVPIWLRDVDGRVIIPGAADQGPGSRPAELWQVVDSEAGAARAFNLVGRAPAAKLDLFIAPLKTSVGEIGAIVMPADWGSDDPAERRSLERAVTILASTAAESCEGQLDLHRRLGELDALFRLSSLLVKAGEQDQVLNTALDLALDVLGLDAGSISVLDDSGNLVHRAARHLSDKWLERSSPLSIDGTLRAQALSGEIVQVANLATDPRIADHERPNTEGLSSFVIAGLVYQGRAAGIIRLYSRTPREFTTEQSELLRAIADHLAMVLAHSRLRQLREADKQMQRQVRLAADVQRRMLPRSVPVFERFDIAARYAPSFELGGDFYDLEKLHGQLALAVGDVVGKGVPAALIMSAVRSALRAYSTTAPTLADLVSKVNIATVRDTMESEFVTLWVGLLDPATLRLTCCAAGHDPAWLFRTEPGHGIAPEVHGIEIGTSGMVAGVDPAQVYEETTHQLRPGDVLLAHTDGLTDAVDFDDNKFGRARVRDTVATLLASEPEATASRIIEHLAWTLRQFCGVRMSTDDVTVVVVRVRN